MRGIEKQIKKLVYELDHVNKIKRKIIKKIVKVCLEIIELTEKKKISLTKADHLFGYFLPNDELLPNDLHDVILDGASLELPAKVLKEKPEVNIKSIKERLLKLK